MSLLETSEPTVTEEVVATEPTVETEEVTEEVVSDKPEWLGEFETPEDMAKAYGDLKGSVPDEYTLKEYDEFVFHSDTDNDVANFMVMAKELNMSQESFDKVVDYYVASEKQRTAIDMEARKAIAHDMLGGSKVAPERISTIAAKAKTSMSSEQYDLFRKATSSGQDSGAAALLLVESLIKGETKPLGSNTASAIPAKSKGELQQMMSDSRYKTDPEYRKQVMDGFKVLHNEL